MKKEKVNILRLVAFSTVLCVAAVLAFALSSFMFERISRWLGESSDTTKNAYWLLNHLQNLTLIPMVAILCGIFHKKSGKDEITALYHREKKLSLVILTVFLYLVFMPYYISQNIAGDMSVFEALGDRTAWFVTQLISLSAFIMYQTDRENKLLEQTGEAAKNEE